ncbi:MAG: threonine synthase [Elusimicrobiaceae bacterium]|nr:threonine synthase [Elusimicrobiaceae bacterium]
MKKILSLQCINCGKEHKLSDTRYLCTACAGNLEITYDYKLIKKRLDYDDLEKNTTYDMWRYIDILPVDDNKDLPPVKVGWTPLYEAEDLAKKLGIANLFIKDEGRNPTGSIKDRGSAVVVARALELNEKVISTASNGNASDSLACLTANLHMETVIFMPKTVPYPKLVQLLVFGAHVVLVDGSYDDAFELNVKATEKYGWYTRAAGYNPFVREGKKTCAFEICEQLEWEAPDKVIVSVGDGSVFSGLWKGFVDFNKLGIIEKMPQMIAVQPEGSAALKKAFDNGGKVEHIKAKTIADTLAVNYPRDAQMALQALDESGGFVTTVKDNEIIEAISELAKGTNVFAEPAGAVPYAALKNLVKEGKIKSDESVVLVVTGYGLKDIDTAIKSVKQEHPKTIKPTLEELEKAINMEKLIHK